MEPSAIVVYPERDGIREAIGPLSGRNAVAAAFYDGPGWPRFRPWEQAFLWLTGGPRRARREILRHVLTINTPRARVLEVGIGDGANVPLVPPGWTVHGVDIARTQLVACLRHCPELSGRLYWAEAESLPFPDGTFDACWSIGGFTYYRDHEAALREMRRVTRPGGPVVVADEVPGLHRYGIGHLLGRPALDARWMNWLGLDRDFVAMIFDFSDDIEGAVRRACPGAARLPVWHRLGYCYVDPPPPRPGPPATRTAP